MSEHTNTTDAQSVTTTDAPTEPARRGLRVPDGALWASAVLLVALILTQAARVNDTPAFAEMAVKSNGYSLVTTEAGNAEALVVVDDRAESLLVYTIEPGGLFELRVNQPLTQMFLDARRQTGVRP
ncbi:MAG: hypothetical protein DHS20C14_22710 [Phycisphaeraceae bacterium]|nr:MAG: hypothetical protein DHS20C14_22710 [Phycisphaeraceae bacterium]